MKRYRTIIQNPTALCDSPKTDTTTPGKLGRAVRFWTRAWIWNCTVAGSFRIQSYCWILYNSPYAIGKIGTWRWEAEWWWWPSLNSWDSRDECHQYMHYCHHSRSILNNQNSEPSMTHSSDSGFSDPYNTFKKVDVSGGYYEQGVSSNKSLSIDNWHIII